MADATTVSDHSDSAAERASKKSIIARSIVDSLHFIALIASYNNHFANYTIQSSKASRRFRFLVDAGEIKFVGMRVSECVYVCVCVCVYALARPPMRVVEKQGKNENVVRLELCSAER
jgi:hypothetical protein